jgi:hypothetical protein
MSRAQGNVIVVKPTNNVYTVLLAVAVVMELLAVVVVFVQYGAQFGKPLFAQ